MIFYIKPCFSKEKSYYSLVTSFLIFSFSIYYILFNKGTVSLQYLLFLVGFTSILHHCRSFSHEYKDFIRILDIVFANILGIYILYLYYNCLTFGILIIISFVFLYSQNKCKSSKNQSFLHSFIHILVCLILIINYP